MGITLQLIDFYDDSEGKVLKEVFPEAKDLPEEIKTAHILSPEERDVLRNEAYALVMIEEGRSIRKFACVDLGNTILSKIYLERNKDLLPEEAIKVASVNIDKYLDKYSKEKTAAKMRRTRDSAMQPIVGDEADWASRTNLMSIRGGLDTSKVLSSAQQMKTASVVDVSGYSSTKIVKEKQASVYAMKNHYPLDSYSDVKKAVSYFEDNWTEMSPEDRHEFCVKTAARAEDLGIEVPDEMARYGSSSYSSDLEAHIINRKAVCEPEWKSVYNELLEKKAEIGPETFARFLGKVDESAGINWYYGKEIADPYFATFGESKEKVAESAWSWKSAVGDFVTHDQLNWLARDGRGAMLKVFAPDIVDAFQKNPVMIFSSLPETSKTLIARLANSKNDGLHSN